MTVDPAVIAADEARLITALLVTLRREFEAAACSVAVVGDAGLIFVAAVGEGAAQVLGMQLPLSRGLAGYVAVSGQGIAVADVHADRRFDREAAESTGYVPQAITAVPVFAVGSDQPPTGSTDEDEDTVAGVLEVLDPAAGDPVALLTRAAEVADQVGQVRALGAARDRVAQLTEAERTDPELAALHADLGRVAGDPARLRLIRRLVAAVLEP